MSPCAASYAYILHRPRARGESAKQGKLHNIHERNSSIVVTNLAELPVASEDDIMRCVL